MERGARRGGVLAVDLLRYSEKEILEKALTRSNSGFLTSNQWVVTSNPLEQSHDVLKNVVNTLPFHAKSAKAGLDKKGKRHDHSHAT